jgi:hypothetical protein
MLDGALVEPATAKSIAALTTGGRRSAHQETRTR